MGASGTWWVPCPCPSVPAHLCTPCSPRARVLPWVSLTFWSTALLGPTHWGLSGVYLLKKVQRGEVSGRNTSVADTSPGRGCSVRGLQAPWGPGSACGSTTCGHCPRGGGRLGVVEAVMGLDAVPQMWPRAPPHPELSGQGALPGRPPRLVRGVWSRGSGASVWEVLPCFKVLIHRTPSPHTPGHPPPFPSHCLPVGSPVSAQG